MKLLFVLIAVVITIAIVISGLFLILQAPVDERQMNITRDLAECGKKETGLERDMCYYSVAESYEEPVICDMIEPNIGYYVPLNVGCMIDIGIKKSDPSVCDSFQNQTYRDTCYFQFGYNFNDSSYCERVQYELMKGICFQMIATTYDNPDECNKIENKSFRIECLTYVALYSNIPEACEQIEIIAYKDRCYYSVAIQDSEPYPCMKIENQTMREECLEKPFYNV
jgi:hypothetical protein